MYQISVLGDSKLLKKDDLKFLEAHSKAFEDRFVTRSIFRSKYEMETLVLDNTTHPTPDSKYWQAIGEQSVHVEELVRLGFESKKLEAEIENLELDIEYINETPRQFKSNESELKHTNVKIKLKQIEIDKKKFDLTIQKKTAKERISEIKNWEELIIELEPKLKYGKEDFGLHHQERYLLRYSERAKLLDQASPEERIHILQSLKNITQKDQHNFFDKKALEMAEPIVKNFFNRKVHRILLASPHRTQNDQMCTNFQKLQPPAGFDCVLEMPYGFSVPDARNFIVHKAIEEYKLCDDDYIFQVDDDLILPTNALVQLLHLNTEVCGGFYYRKYFPLESCGMFEDKEKRPTSLTNYNVGDIIHDTLVLPSGCSLIKVGAFKKLEAPWYKMFLVQGRPTVTEDTYICERFRQAKIDIITDTGVQAIHVNKSTGVLYGHPDIIDREKNDFKPGYQEQYAI